MLPDMSSRIHHISTCCGSGLKGTAHTKEMEARLASRIVSENVDRDTDQYRSAMDLIQEDPKFVDEVNNLAHHSGDLRTSIADLITSKRTMAICLIPHRNTCYRISRGPAQEWGSLYQLGA
jgi:hypothetical protein